MQSSDTIISGCKVVKFDTYFDDRGYFEESYNAKAFSEIGMPTEWHQDNVSWSSPGVLRGLHMQTQNPQGKLVRCLKGEIWDVCVDMRRHSRTFLCWVPHVLSERNREGFYIPPGCAHGFKVMGDEPALVQYKCTTVYNRESDFGIRYDEPKLGVIWPGSSHKLSEKDSKFPYLRANYYDE